MNVQDHSTKTAWLKAYRLARQSETTSARTVEMLSGSMALLYLDALTSIASRHSHASALMNRPMTSIDQARWLVDYRCRSYTNGRLPV